MAPDLNSLPPSSSDLRSTRSMSSNSTNHNGEGSPSQSPRSPSTTLQAAATLNAGLQRGEPVRRSSSSSLSQRAMQSSSTGRRRSQVLMNLHIADPTTPAPGEMVDHSYSIAASAYRTTSPQPIPGSPRLTSPNDPRHSRAPSLGELHQELENEQEFQVNRLLQEIRRLQVQVQRQQSGQSDEAVSERSASIPIQSSAASASAPTSAYPHHGGSVPRSPGFPRSSFDMARADLQRRSRTPSRGASPRLRATSISGESGDQFALGGRDESTFYQAETQMLMRENQMLRHRIRELERQLSEASGSNTAVTHEPTQSSHLNRSMSVSEDDSRPPPPISSSLPTVTDAPKEE